MRVVVSRQGLSAYLAARSARCAAKHLLTPIPIGSSQFPGACAKIMMMFAMAIKA